MVLGWLYLEFVGRCQRLLLSCLARSFSASLKWSFVDGCNALLDVVFMEGEEQPELQGHRENYV